VLVTFLRARCSFLEVLKEILHQEPLLWVLMSMFILNSIKGNTAPEAIVVGADVDVHSQ
jgi:hypothetical protein